MAEQTIISKTSTAGQVIEIKIAPEWEGSSFFKTLGYLDGECIARGISTFGRPKVVNGKSYVAAVGKLALTKDEVDTVWAAIKTAEANTSEGRIRQLRGEREALLLNVRCAHDDVMSARERAFGEDTGRLWGAVTQAEESARIAENALKDWDASHPEVIAAIKAENKAKAERHAWD